MRGHSARRRSLLREDPEIDVVDMTTLVGIARAIEEEAVRRYALLAELMDHRGEPATAAAFRVMLEEERNHVVAVDRWAASVGEPETKAHDVEWRLPADLSSSWEDVAGSALLTPYRAFALAVENEERAFSFYAYLAARADSAHVRAEAEKLGNEELRHAALLRRWRRRAYHRERGSRQARRPGPAELQFDSVAALRDFLALQEAEIAAIHLGLAQRLARAGDQAGANMLERAIPASTAPSATSAVTVAVIPSAPDASDDTGENTRHLLVDAQKPLEALADVLEAVMATAEGEIFEEAAITMAGVIDRIARITLHAD
ncbi:ferritin family protein [Luteimonas sp. YGD11-2]|uniref:ferritin-like domain-containing protein n=1 Tax=Luteimonas sp. YGD11-2 TaxID=2508168 RepID=UPI0019D6F167|nr:ferritin family protein [Luteimonas sp. YGD11-2]